MARIRRNTLYEAVILLIALFIVSLVPLWWDTFSRVVGFLYWKVEYGIVRVVTWFNTVGACVVGNLHAPVENMPEVILPSEIPPLYAGAKLVAVRWTPVVREAYVLTSTTLPEDFDALLVLPKGTKYMVVGKVLNGRDLHYWVRLIWDDHFKIPASAGGIIGWFEQIDGRFYFAPISSPINPIPAGTEVVWLGNAKAFLGQLSSTITSAEPVRVWGVIPQLRDLPMGIMLEGGYK
jgi:hypothetical protein